MTADISQLTETAKQYKQLKEQEKLLKERQDQLKKILVDALKTDGQPDASGHIILELDGIEIKHQRRESESLDEDIAWAILDAKGIREECTQIIKVPDQDKIRAAFYKDSNDPTRITEEELDKMFPKKVTYALIV